MPSEEKWNRYFKACGAIAAIVSTLGLIGGGGFGLYTFYHQGVAAKALKQQEIRLMLYDQKKEVYYELADAAAAVATSTNKENAMQKAAQFSTLYFGRAHIFVIDSEVMKAKINFHKKMKKELKSGTFPSDLLKGEALSLTNACKKALRVEEIFSD